MDIIPVSVGFWSIVPSIIAIALALITKEVIFSLVIGILSGTIIYTIAAKLSFMGVFSMVTDLMADKIGSNASMVIFLALLGALVATINMAGGSQAYGNWASKKLSTARSAGVATGLLGCIIFIDDYFNCLTVGTVMRPVTDKHLISREKLAYIIDATAAPVCIIAPISSWAASVVSYYPENGSMSGMTAFLSSVPMNLYAILTLFMVFWLVIRKKGDYGPMAAAQRRVKAAGKVTATDQETSESELEGSAKGTIFDLVVPVIFLIIFAIITLLYYGGMWDGSGKNLFQAFGDTDAGPALALASLGALILAFFQFVLRKLISFKDFFSAIGKGIKSMVPAIVILCLAWTISGVCRDLLATGTYVADVVKTSALPVMLIPAIMFIIAAFLSFATGTSWGTFGILIPIILAVCEAVAPELSITSLSAILAGSVFGDHCSPISDTTIMSSTGAGCKHIDHVSTQIPYTLTVAAVCFLGYIVAGLTNPLGYGISLAITLAFSFVVLIVTLLVIPKLFKSNKEVEEVKA